MQNSESIRVITYDAFKTVFHKIHSVKKGIDQGSLQAVNRNYSSTNFFNNIPRTRDIVNNGTINHDDQTFGILNQRSQDTKHAKINFISSETFFSNSSTSDPVINTLLNRGEISSVVNEYVQRFIERKKEQQQNVADMFKQESEEKIHQTWDLKQNDKEFIVTLPVLQSSFAATDHVTEFRQFRLSQESLQIASGLISSMRNYESFEQQMEKLLKKIFRAISLPRFGNDIKKCNDTECFEYYATQLIQNTDDCFITKTSFLLLSEVSILLKLIRKFFQGNEIIRGIIRIIDSTIQRDVLNYENVSVCDLIDVITDFGVIYNNQKSMQTRETGIDKIDQITRKRYQTKTGNKHVLGHLQFLKKCISERLSEEEIIRNTEFVNFVNNEKKGYLLFVLRHKFKLIFEGNFTEVVDKILFNSDIFDGPLYVRN